MFVDRDRVVAVVEGLEPVVVELEVPVAADGGRRRDDEGFVRRELPVAVVEDLVRRLVGGAAHGVGRRVQLVRVLREVLRPGREEIDRALHEDRRRLQGAIELGGIQGRRRTRDAQALDLELDRDFRLPGRGRTRARSGSRYAAPSGASCPAGASTRDEDLEAAVGVELRGPPSPCSRCSPTAMDHRSSRNSSRCRDRSSCRAGRGSGTRGSRRGSSSGSGNPGCRRRASRRRGPSGRSAGARGRCARRSARGRGARGARGGGSPRPGRRRWPATCSRKSASRAPFRLSQNSSQVRPSRIRSSEARSSMMSCPLPARRRHLGVSEWRRRLRKPRTAACWPIAVRLR